MGGNVTIEDLERFNAKKPDFELTEKAIDLAIYFYDLQERAPVIDAVCDAIEGFCGATCEWSELETEVGYAASCSGWYRGCNEDGTCPHCNRRVIERFDILKEEGV